MKRRYLATGKVPPGLLGRLLRTLPPLGKDVVVGPKVGEDAAVLRPGKRLLVTATDPITFVTEDIGWYAVHVNANDIAVMGARPRWFQAVVLLPEKKATASLAESIFAQIRDACAELGAQLVGGHFEVTYALPRPIVVGQMMGETIGPHPITSSGAKPGDALILTKGIALEGTALLAREAAPRLQNAGLGQAFLRRARSLLRKPGISVVAEAVAATEARTTHAMHDPTEGGLATAVRELSQASRLGATIDLTAVPILRETKTVCQALGLDPLGLLASGSLLIAVAERDCDALVRAVRARGVEAARIGTLTPPAERLLMQGADGRLAPLPKFEADEVTRIL